jgi:hypothetical protein
VYRTVDPAQSTNGAPARTMFEAHHCLSGSDQHNSLTTSGFRTTAWLLGVLPAIPAVEIGG